MPINKLAQEIKFVFLVSGYWLLVSTFSYADSLSRAEALYLQGSYSESLDECAQNIERGKELDRAYYFAGLNYLKINDSQKAREKLKIVIDGYPKSKFSEAAKLAYADTYFIDQEYPQAKKLYEEITKGSGALCASAYLGLIRCDLKLGDWQGAKEYAKILQNKFPLSLEAQVAQDSLKDGDFFFTVQVGSFASSKNAQKLMLALKAKSFDSYIDELNAGKSILYRVRVGKLKSREEALSLKNGLDQEGYPTRIFP